MTPRDIRATLRGATKAGVLSGWYFYGGRGSLPVRYVVSPPGSYTSTYETKDATSYCEMLLASGVQALYLSPRTRDR